MRWLDPEEIAAIRRQAGEQDKPYSNGSDGDPRLSSEEARPPKYSDEALALRYAEIYGDTARYVAAWGKWLLWTGSHWRFDATMQTFNMARGICRAASAEIAAPKAIKLAAAVASAKTVAAIIGLARADRRHAATVEQWDTDALLLGTTHEGHNDN